MRRCATLLLALLLSAPLLGCDRRTQQSPEQYREILEPATAARHDAAVARDATASVVAQALMDALKRGQGDKANALMWPRGAYERRFEPNGEYDLVQYSVQTTDGTEFFRDAAEASRLLSAPPEWSEGFYDFRVVAFAVPASNIAGASGASRIRSRLLLGRHRPDDAWWVVGVGISP